MRTDTEIIAQEEMEMEKMERPYTRLKETRRTRQITQLELAYRSGVSSSAIEKLECGFSLPKRTTAEKLAKALGCQISDIYPNCKLKEG